MNGKSYCLAAAVLFAFITLGALPAFAQNVRDIRITGLERIEPETVISYMDVRQGDPVTQETLEQAVKKLFRTGLLRMYR
jgi:outer membrane protein insertion porin family